MADGPEREEVLLVILRAFHSYLLKYTDMIQRGHLPTYKGHASNDTVYFLRQFLRPGDKPVRANLQAACRTLHLAFPHQSFDEVYNILTGLMIKVINTYDPHYTDKVKLVVEAINRLADPRERATGLRGRSDQSDVMGSDRGEISMAERTFRRSGSPNEADRSRAATR
jgi:hypothetical protein